MTDTLSEQRRQRRVAILSLPPHYLRTSDAEARTGIPRRTLRRWCQDGRIPATKVGPRTWYLDPGAAVTLSHTLKPGPQPKKHPTVI